MEININDDVSKLVGVMQIEILRLQAVIRALEGKVKKLDPTERASASGQTAAIN